MGADEAYCSIAPSYIASVVGQREGKIRGRSSRWQERILGYRFEAFQAFLCKRRRDCGSSQERAL